MDRAADAFAQGRSFPLGAVTLTADGFHLREVGNGQAGELTNPHTFAAFAALFTR